MTSTAHLPFVSVVIVNYNGAEYLPTCLDALQSQSYPRESFEVIVSDNGSKDGSLDLMLKKYPWVRVLENKQNLGFSSGNNVAMRAARGDYAALINNDTLACANWLEELVAVAQDNPLAGLVTGRLQLYYDQLVLQIATESLNPNGEREASVQLYNVNSGAPRSVIQYLEGFDGWDNSRPGMPARRTRGTARLGVSVPQGNEDWTLRLSLAAAQANLAPVRVRVSGIAGVNKEWTVSTIEPSEFEMQIPASSRKMARPLVQSTGAVVFRTGSSRDRGSYARSGEVLYETDDGQYNRVEQVFSGCGANLLIRRDILDKVGAFDDDFFMYYEDTDLAWRTRLHGWQVLYAPNAVVRHIHCGTAEEWSSLFFYLVERNRLAMVFKNGARRQVISTWARFVSSIAQNTAIVVRAFLSGRPMSRLFRNLVRSQYRALFALLFWIPGLIIKRIQVQKARTVPFAEIEKWFMD